MTNSRMFRSPAKLNLGLKVVGRRADGYHLLETIFCLVDLYDEISIEVMNDSSEISLIEHQQPWEAEIDLACRAAKLLQKTTKTNLGAQIKVTKNIPVGGGMGGGSSNAATVLVALNHLWQTNLTQNELIELGKTLGADVPFFIYGKNAFATGIGDEFTLISLPELHFVLIEPNFSISTKKIFTNLNIAPGSVDAKPIKTDYLLQTKDNDLESVAVKLYPELKNIIKDLSAYGNPRMTGSGSVFYLSFLDSESAKKVAYLLKNRYNPLLVKSLHQSPLFSCR